MGLQAWGEAVSDMNQFVRRMQAHVALSATYCPICQRVTKHAPLEPFEGMESARCAVCGCAHNVPWVEPEGHDVTEK